MIKLNRRRLIIVSLALVMTASFAINNPASAQDPQLRFGNQVPPEVERIYEKGLAFLVESQSKTTGDWNKGQSNGHGAAGAAMSGMGIMAFLASGEDPNHGKYADNILRAVESLVSSQNASTGYFGGSMYHHGFGMLGLAEVYGVIDEDRMWKKTKKGRSIGEALTLAVGCAAASQKNNQWGGWRYGPNDNSADTSVSGAVMMGLLATRNAGIKVPDDCIDKGLDYFKKMTSTRGGVGYSGGVGGLGGSKNLQAISGLVLAIGKRKESAQYQGVSKQVTGANLDHREMNYPYYFRYYMAQSIFQADYEAWKKWNTKTIRQLKDMQADDGSFQSGHGKPYGTAMSMLALALNYRFLPIYER